MSISIDKRHATIRVIDSDYNPIRESDSVEANLLFAILEKLEEIRCGLIDVENKIET